MLRKFEVAFRPRKRYYFIAVKSEYLKRLEPSEQIFHRFSARTVGCAVPPAKPWKSVTIENFVRSVNLWTCHVYTPVNLFIYQNSFALMSLIKVNLWIYLLLLFT